MLIFILESRTRNYKKSGGNYDCIFILDVNDETTIIILAGIITIISWGGNKDEFYLYIGSAARIPNSVINCHPVGSSAAPHKKERKMKWNFGLTRLRQTSKVSNDLLELVIGTNVLNPCLLF